MSNSVKCTDCGTNLPHENSETPPGDKKPCPKCGSLNRTVLLSVKAESRVAISDSVSADIRASLGPQFLLAAAFFVREAKRLEQLGGEAGDGEKMQHRAYVVGAIMQAVAAMETEVGEIVRHGPGNHLGSNGTDQEAQAFLKQFVDFVDPLPIVRKYDVVTRLLQKKQYTGGEHLLRDANLLIDLRNELVH
jgi:hypothetical protein